MTNAAFGAPRDRARAGDIECEGRHRDRLCNKLSGVVHAQPRPPPVKFITVPSISRIRSEASIQQIELRLNQNWRSDLASLFIVEERLIQSGAAVDDGRNSDR
jgi:hypothetical protein